MERMEKFKFDDVPHHAILVAATSEPDYEMDRIVIAEDWESYGDYVVIYGGHCSCYDFDQTQWSAIKYTKDELVKVLKGWAETGWGVERIIVPTALAALGETLK